MTGLADPKQRISALEARCSFLEEQLANAYQAMREDLAVVREVLVDVEGVDCRVTGVELKTTITLTGESSQRLRQWVSLGPDVAPPMHNLAADLLMYRCQALLTAFGGVHGRPGYIQARKASSKAQGGTG